MDDQSDKISRLEDRIEQLEATTKKMMPTRRDALKYGGAAAIGAAAMSGTASAGSSQVGTIGDSNNLVDIEAEDVNVSDTLTTQDIIVNGTATGPFGGGGLVLESGDSITVETLGGNSTDQGFVTLYNGSAKDVLGGAVNGLIAIDFLYTFSDSSTIRQNGSGTSYGYDPANGEDQNGDQFEVAFLPPAKDVTKIEVGADNITQSSFGARVIFLD